MTVLHKQWNKSDISELKPTEEQSAVIESISLPESLMINARAGCAKTSTLQLAAPRVRSPALALAFNKKIAKELEPRLPGNFAVKTLNGMGHSAWARALPGLSRVELDDKKLGKLVSQVAKERKQQLSSDQWIMARGLASKVMSAGITPGDIGEPLIPDSEENWLDIADSMWLPREEFDYIKELAREVIERDIALANQGIISFDDQVYCSVCLGGKFPKYPVVFIDEAQDLSPLNHAMLAKCLARDGKLVAVGDEAQAIYAFRNASGDSMERIRKLRAQWTDRPLNTTFRCPKAIVARQQSHVPGFMAWSTNREGRVIDLRPGAGPVTGWTWAQVASAAVDQLDSTAVLCRNNAPLLGLAFKLLRQQIGVVMLGRDIGKGLTVLSKKILPSDDLTAEKCVILINDWMEKELGRARANKQEEKAESIYDRAECLQAVISGSQCRDAGMLRAMLERLFSRDSGLVTLSTIHRAKGLEWSTVLHLDPFRVPSKQARKELAAGNPVPMTQERNLLYVCETRTKNILINANLEDFES